MKKFAIILLCLLSGQVSLLALPAKPLHDTLMLELEHTQGYKAYILLQDKVWVLLKNGDKLRGRLIAIRDTLLIVAGKTQRYWLSPDSLAYITLQNEKSPPIKLSVADDIFRASALTAIGLMTVIALQRNHGKSIDASIANRLSVGIGAGVLGGIVSMIVSWNKKKRANKLLQLQKEWQIRITPQTPEAVRKTNKRRFWRAIMRSSP